MTIDPALLAARAHAEAAKARLDASVADAKLRLQPRALALDTVAGIKAKSGELARGGVAMVKARPAVGAGIVAAVAVILARKPIAAKVSGLLPRDATTARNKEFHRTNRASAPMKE